ncbi:MAG: Lrp/AsnC family transcriptional regulator [Nanoarchaeota archaeon]
MEKVKLTTKDERILEALDKNANIPLSRLSKKVGVSRQVAEYRLKKLLLQKTIYQFYTLIDVGRMGYSSFRVHIRIKNVDKEKYSNFAKDLFDNYPTFWVGFISGKFDIIADIFAKNPNDFERIISEVLKKHKNLIQSYEVLQILELDLFEYGYFFQNNHNRMAVAVHKNEGITKIDDIDKKILHKIKDNSRIAYEEVAEYVGITRNSIKNRIKKLEQKRIIAGYKIIVNFNHFGNQSFKILIKYNSSKMEQEKQLLEEIRQTPKILNILKFLGSWNLDIEIHAKDIRELQEYIIGLRNKYSLIEDYEIIQIIDDHGIDFYPKKIK